MLATILLLFFSIRQGFRTRAEFQAEIIALRHQLLVSVPKTSFACVWLTDWAAGILAKDTNHNVALGATRKSKPSPKSERICLKARFRLLVNVGLTALERRSADSWAYALLFLLPGPSSARRIGEAYQRCLL